MKKLKVNMIKTAFVEGSVFHPTNNPLNPKEGATNMICLVDVECGGRFFTEMSFCNKAENNKSTCFTAQDLMCAVDELLTQNFHFFKVKTYGRWEGYICSQNPRYNKDIVNEIQLPDTFG